MKISLAIEIEEFRLYWKSLKAFEQKNKVSKAMLIYLKPGKRLDQKKQNLVVDNNNNGKNYFYIMPLLTYVPCHIKIIKGSEPKSIIVRHQELYF